MWNEYMLMTAVDIFITILNNTAIVFNWYNILIFMGGFPGGSVVKNLPTVQEIWVQSLGWEDPLEKEMATHSSFFFFFFFLENPMNRGACCAIVYGVTKRVRLSDYTTTNIHTHTHTHNTNLFIMYCWVHQFPVNSWLYKLYEDLYSPWCIQKRLHCTETLTSSKDFSGSRKGGFILWKSAQALAESLLKR